MTSSLAAHRISADIWNAGYECLVFTGADTFCDYWKVRDRTSLQLATWKQVRPEFTQNETVLALLQNEVQVGREVHSPFVAQLRDADLASPAPWVLFEWLEGPRLDQQLHEGSRWSIPQALWIVRRCAQGLADLAQARFTHENLQPARIWVGPSGALRLLDLSQARRLLMSGHREIDQDRGTRPPDHEVAPAQSGSEHARDFHALGLLLYRLLTGELPYSISPGPAHASRRQEDLRPALYRHVPGISAGLCDLLQALLSRQIDRIPHPQALVDALVGLEIGEIHKSTTAVPIS